MNRKNTILIAVVINAALLAVLLVAALTVQEDLPEQNTFVREESLQLPQIEDVPLYQELPNLALKEPESKPIQEETPSLVHKLPPVKEEIKEVVSIPAPVKSLPTAELKEIVVKKGDSLDKLARLNHTSVDEIVKLNRLSSTFLKIGQVLKMPEERKLASSNAQKKIQEPKAQYYTIKVGENPWAIAMRHHMKVDELLKLNGLNEAKARKLKPGDRLRIR